MVDTDINQSQVLLDAPVEALRRYFGYSEFRPGQQEVVEKILSGKDVVVIMPTGSGKSLCYQLPALLMPGATLVVSPLIALMKDQVDALRARGLPAVFINSSIPEAEQRRRIEGLQSGKYKLIYVAPERFRSPRFVAALSSVQISLLAVDEAHCVSTWGHDFRPDYLHLKTVLETLGRPQIAALSATATPFVRSDIVQQLALREAITFVSGFDRPNLHIRVEHELAEYDKVARIRKLAQNTSGSGIVYATTRKSVEQIGTQLSGMGIKASSYHAGMSDSVRIKTQEAFMTGKSQVIVATNAFGMGIDKPDIRFVVHYNFPGSIEAYYQEIGRAGRDSLPSTCLLLFNYFDRNIHEFFIENSYPDKETIQNVFDALVATDLKRIYLGPKEIAARAGMKSDAPVKSVLGHLERVGHIKQDGRSILMMDEPPAKELRINTWELKRRAGIELRKLEDMIRYCYSTDCYRAEILNYFGDPHSLVRCGVCSNCTGKGNGYQPRPKAKQKRQRSAAPQPQVVNRPRKLSDEEYLCVRKVLACAKRMNGRYGKNLLAATLRGSAAKNVMSFKLNELSTYGLLRGMVHDQVLGIVDALITAECLIVNGDDFPTVAITALGERVMREQEMVELGLP
jgi:ATP-dependent DNA helicase RecQ